MINNQTEFTFETNGDESDDSTTMKFCIRNKNRAIVYQQQIEENNKVTSVASPIPSQTSTECRYERR